MVEGFFSKMTKQMLNGIRVSSKEELEKRIYKYFEEINEVPIPYHWSYKLDDIDIEKEDLSQIIYEVVNRKAAKPTDKDKRAPKPRTRKKREQSATQQSWNIILIKLGYTSIKKFTDFRYVIFIITKFHHTYQSTRMSM